MSALPAAGFSGAISLPLLPDLIQIYTISMADGALTIGSGTRSGTIWFERGAMVHAVCGETIGEEAVYQLIQWHDGRFSLDKDARAPFHSIHTSWQEVLMEGCRRLDEAALTEVPEDEPDDVESPLDAVCARIQRYLAGFLAVAILDSRDGSLLAQRGEEISLRSAGPAPCRSALAAHVTTECRAGSGGEPTVRASINAITTVFMRGSPTRRAGR